MTGQLNLIYNNSSIHTNSNFSLKLLPVKIGLSYLVITFILFVVWPINWLIYDPESWIIVISYVSVCFASLGLAFWYASSRNAKYFVESRWWNWLIPTGGILAVLLLFPQCYIYTDRWPWEVFEALND